ncbi:MAG: putative immunity protein, partial [Alphaproteobacteria bacterium]
MWADCERPDWLLWWAAHSVPRQELVLAACDCAELALRYVPQGEDRPRLAIETARRWARGEATVKEVRAADAAALAAVCDAGDAAAYAALTGVAVTAGCTALTAARAADCAARA